MESFVISNSTSLNVERSWYFLTVLLRIGRPCRPEEISVNCSLFYVSPETVIQSCFLRDSPLAITGGHFIVPSRVSTSALGKFMTRVETPCLWPRIRVASPCIVRKRIWDGIVSTYSRKRRNINASFRQPILFHSGNDKQQICCEDPLQKEAKVSSNLNPCTRSEAASSSSKVSGSANLICEKACLVPFSGFSMGVDYQVIEATVPPPSPSHLSPGFEMDSSNLVEYSANMYRSVDTPDEVLRQVISVQLPVLGCEIVRDKPNAIIDVQDSSKAEALCISNVMQVTDNIFQTADTQPLAFSLNEFIVCNDVSRTSGNNADSDKQLLDISKIVETPPITQHGDFAESKNSHAQMTLSLAETDKKCNYTEPKLEIPVEVPDSFDEGKGRNCRANEVSKSNKLHRNSKSASGNCTLLEYINDTNWIPKNEVDANNHSCQLLEATHPILESNNHIDVMKDMHQGLLSLDMEPKPEVAENNIDSASKPGERHNEEKYVSMKKPKRSRKHTMPVKSNRPNPTQKMTKNQLEPKVLPTFEDFIVEEEEGSGGYGTVYRARRKHDGNMFAIKCPHANAHVHHVNNELKMLERFGGRNFVIKYEGSFKNENSDCFILEHVEHDRPEILKKEIDMFELQWYGYCMFRALASLHKQGVLHRDVKPGNFLFSRKFNKGYLIDFNLALDLHQKFSTVRNMKSNADGKYHSAHHRPLSNNKTPSASTSSLVNGRSLETLSSLGGFQKENSVSKEANKKIKKSFLNICDNGKYRSHGADGSGVTQAKETTSTITPSAEGLRQPLPYQGRKELISLVQEAMQCIHRESTTISTSKRKRIPAPVGKIDRFVFLTPMPVQSNDFALPGSASLKSKGDGKHRREGPCVGTKGFRAPEVLLKSPHQGYKVDTWSAGVTLLYFMIGKSPFGGEPEQNIRDIAKLRGSEELWELAKLHGRDASFPADLFDARALQSMKLQKWCELNTRRHDFLKVIPNSLFDLIDKCLEVNPRLRIDAEEALAHEFFAPCHEALRKNRMRRRGLISNVPISKSNDINSQEEGGGTPFFKKTLELVT